MRVAIVHDYIREFGGAERVLEALCEIYPDAPIYTAFCSKSSTAYEHFKDKKIIESWAAVIPFFPKLASPLRFLTPWIWGTLDLSKYDLVISSASWFITKGFGRRSNQQLATSNQKKPIEICYCHTPPRWLYGYSTSVSLQKYAIVRLYASVVGHFLRLYDFKQAQKVDYFIANSNETAGRIKKFYRRDSTVIYPPVDIARSGLQVASSKLATRYTPQATSYYLIVSRIVGTKGLELAVEAAVKAGFELKIAGSPAGYYPDQQLRKMAAGPEGPLARRVEFLGQVSDEELAILYKHAKGFLALSKDEDFGITPVESMMAGTPVVAFNGGGYKETVIDGKTGILFDDYSVDGLIAAIKKFEKTKFDPQVLITHAEKFSKERFKKEIKEFVDKVSK